MELVQRFQKKKMAISLHVVLFVLRYVTGIVQFDTEKVGRKKQSPRSIYLART